MQHDSAVSLNGHHYVYYDVLVQVSKLDDSYVLQLYNYILTW